MASKKKTASKKVTKKETPSKSRTATQNATVHGQRHSKAQIDYQELVKEASVLVKGSLAACKQAANIIARLVYDDPPQKTMTITDALLFLLSVNVSQSSLPGYATLDRDFIAQIDSFVSTIEAYVNDPVQQRPLNFLMLASPGAGKSHFINCVAKRLAAKSISAISFNMASMQSNDDLVPALDAARNLKVEDRLPLLFLDEFDSAQGNYPLLLPLLWDGGLNLRQHDLRLGKVIVVMAGSDPALPDTMDHARSMRGEMPQGAGHNPKLIDLFSRINGGILKIPPFYDAVNKIDRRADKVCIAIMLIRDRFGSRLSTIPVALLRFIALMNFRYDVRSIAHLIDLIPYQDRTEHLTIEELRLPLDTASRLKESSLAYHLLHEDQAHGAVKNWDDAVKGNFQIRIDASRMEILNGIAPNYWERFLPQLLRF